MSEAKRAASMVTAMQSGQSGGVVDTHAAAAGKNLADADLFRDFEDEVDAHAGGTIPAPKRRGAGRPPGSVNRTTLQLQRYLMARGYSDPAERLAALASTDPLTLARRLAGYDDDYIGPVLLDPDMVVRVLGHVRAAAEALMPYFHQRAPVRVETTETGGNARPLFVITDGPTQINVGMPGAPQEAQQNQTLSVHAVEVSHGQVSYEDKKT